MNATIILPTTGDRAPVLPFSIGSVLKQTEQDWELFVVGDGTNPATEQVIGRYCDADDRIRFFSFPKDQSRGERNRHSVLQQANGDIVCYLCDRDLYLPNHLSVMHTVLEKNDIAQSLPTFVSRDGKIVLQGHGFDLSLAEERDKYVQGKPGLPLSFMAHRLDAYRRLPEGWRQTPQNVPTDRYMVLQFLEQDWVRAETAYIPTAIYLKRGDYPGLSSAERAVECKQYFDRYCISGGDLKFRSELFFQMLQLHSQHYDQNSTLGDQKSTPLGASRGN